MCSEEKKRNKEWQEEVRAIDKLLKSEWFRRMAKTLDDEFRKRQNDRNTKENS